MVVRIVIGGVLIVVGLVALLLRVLLTDLPTTTAVALMVATWGGILVGTFMAAHATAMIVKRQEA